MVRLGYDYVVVRLSSDQLGSVIKDFLRFITQKLGFSILDFFWIWVMKCKYLI